MPCEIPVADEDMRYLTDQAQEELLRLGKDYTRKLLKEASRLEAARRTHQGDPEITRTMLKDAALLLGRYPQKSKRPWWFILIQVVSSISVWVTGFLFDLDQLQQDKYWLAGFVLSVVIASVFVVLEIVLGRTQ